MCSPARLRAALLAVVALLAALVVVLPAPAAQAAPGKGLVNGSINCPGVSTCPALKLLWFDADWNYVGARKLGGGVRGYSLNLPAGTYHLQLVDQRPSYDVEKFAPSDAKVTVRTNDISERNVTMKRGAAITGVAVAGGKRLGGATLVAANRGRQSFSTQANGSGEFAIGGLPQGQYSVFTYDRRKVWVGKSAWAGAVKPGQAKNMRIRLTKRAGDLTVYLSTPNGLLRSKTTLTVTSKQTGQWWSVTSGSGTFAFKGLHPGGYRAEFKGAGVWFAKTGSVSKATVRPNRFDTGEFHVTQRGGWVTGHLLDGGAPTMTPLEPPYGNGPGATVLLFDRSGAQIARTTSDAAGRFTLQGQLATQTGLSIVVEPAGEGWMRGEGYCKFDRVEFQGLSVTTGRESHVGPLAVPRTPGQQDPACAVPGNDPGNGPGEGGEGVRPRR